jgi:predicted nucleotidyltransferase
MPIWSVALFGSRARGDHEPGSDTDLLLITSESRPRHVLANNMSLSLYPTRHLLKSARGGDLFVCHLVQEAKVLYDDQGRFEKIRKEFKLRVSYDNEIKKASELGWFLFRHGRSFENIPTVNRRIAWCVRTVLIARAAEARHPIFAADALAGFAGSAAVGRLIRHKSSGDLEEKILSDLAEFLLAWGGPDIALGDPSPAAYLRQFQRSGNAVALQTYESGWETDTHFYS